ncbi:SH3 domain-containing protein [Sphingobacterium thalpophilum]|uniref:SH3 domain-containing protein n=1 Tax=Sphingobacterium thalpophilum TaxID=259 RepID=UPI0024A73805|nr:SH3 domain-containing protein [Sphingobacterium thalpophilum]
MIKIINILLATTLSAQLGFSQTIANTYTAVDHEHAFGRCTGSAYCTACRNCSKCAHCTRGGSCGVCNLDMKKKSTPKIKKQKDPVKAPPKPSDNTVSRNKDYRLKKVELKIEKADLRKGPSLDFPIITTIYRSQKLTCLSNIGNWAKVQTDKGLIGFVSSDAIKISSNE